MVSDPAAWTKGLRRGNQQVFEAIFHRYYEELGRYAMRFLADPEEARDLIQAVFIRIWEKRESLPSPLNLGGYLHTSVRNACLNRLEHDKVRLQYQGQQQHVASPLDHTPQDYLEAHETAEKIRSALGSLPERCRQAFLLTRQEGMSYREVADKMGISVKTVEVQVGKALKHLRSHLGETLVILLWLWK